MDYIGIVCHDNKVLVRLNLMNCPSRACTVHIIMYMHVHVDAREKPRV